MTKLRAISFIPVVIYCAAALCFIRDIHSLIDFPLDDAWIHRVYSRSLSMGHGFAYNEGIQEAGSSSPLWSIVTAPAHWFEPFGPDVVIILVKVIGALLGLAAVLMTMILAQRVSGSEWIGCAAATLFALEPRLLFSILSGMETPLLVFLWTSSCAALLHEEYLLSLLLFSLTPITRPEAILILPFSLLAIIGMKRYRGLGAPTVTASLLPAMPMLLWMLFCYHVTGHWLPNTYYLKTAGFKLGLSQLHVTWMVFSQHGFASLRVYVIGLAAFILLFNTVRKSPMITCFLMLALAPAVYLAGVAATRVINPDGYYWTRWVDPASIVLTVPFSIGYGSILVYVAGILKRLIRGVKPINKRAVIAFAGGVTAMLLLGWSVPDFNRSFINRRRQLSSDSHAIAIMNVGMARWIRENTSKNAIVAVNDAGALRYFGERHTIDLMGLNSADVAFGKMSWFNALEKADWVVIFPGWFTGTEFMPELLNMFVPRFVAQIPQEEYTICNSPAQTLKIAYQKKAEFFPFPR